MRRHTYPLSKPYRLSFTTLTSFVSIQVTLISDTGKSAVGEVVPLPGYSNDTEESVLAFLEPMLSKLEGLVSNEARKVFSNEIRRRAFAVSPVLTAIDLLELENFPLNESVSDFVIPTSSASLDHLATTLDQMDIGGTVKLKLTGDIAQDLKCLPVLVAGIERIPSRVRVDANQAYDLDQASQFLEGVKNAGLAAYFDYLEQPLGVDAWSDHQELARRYGGLGIMLDESIVDRKDVDRAAEIGISHIKLKLFKQGGIRELSFLAKYASEKGLGVILGNGVATEICNRVEIGLFVAHPDWFQSPCEANGYLKVKK